MLSLREERVENRRVEGIREKEKKAQLGR